MYHLSSFGSVVLEKNHIPPLSLPMKDVNNIWIGDREQRRKCEGRDSENGREKVVRILVKRTGTVSLIYKVHEVWQFIIRDSFS